MIVAPSVPATIEVVSSGPSSRRKTSGATGATRSTAPKADASDPPMIPMVPKPTTKATIEAGRSVTRNANTNWRSSSLRHDSPGVRSWANVRIPRAAVAPALAIHRPGGTSARANEALTVSSPPTPPGEPILGA